MLGAGENLAVRTRLVEDKADKIIIEKKVRQECDKAQRTNWEEKKEKKTGASVAEFAARGTWMEQNFNQMGNEKCDGLFYVTH